VPSSASVRVVAGFTYARGLARTSSRNMSPSLRSSSLSLPDQPATRSSSFIGCGRNDSPFLLRCASRGSYAGSLYPFRKRPSICFQRRSLWLTSAARTQFAFSPPKWRHSEQGSLLPLARPILSRYIRLVFHSTCDAVNRRTYWDRFVKASHACLTTNI